MTAPPIMRVPRRRGAFGLDERRFADPARVEAELRSFLAGYLPEVWPVQTPSAEAGSAPSDLSGRSGRTLALLMPRGHVAMLRIDRDLDRPDPESVALADRCRAMRIPHATVSSLAEGRAALRRLGVEPRPGPASEGRRAASAFDAVFGKV